MAENTEIVSKQEDPKEPKNLFSLFPKFNLQFPFLKQQQQQREAAVTAGGDKALEEVEETQKPGMVTFPKAQLVVPPPVAVENEEAAAKTSNPLILWQVYAIGGILVLKWIWTRWQERRDRRDQSDKKEGSSDDEQSPADELFFDMP